MEWLFILLFRNRLFSERFEQFLQQQPGWQHSEKTLLESSAMYHDIQFIPNLKKSFRRFINPYIRRYQLQKAMAYLKQGKYKSISETAYAIGYTDIASFVTEFKKVFKKSPFEFLEETS